MTTSRSSLLRAPLALATVLLVAVAGAVLVAGPASAATTRHEGSATYLFGYWCDIPSMQAVTVASLGGLEYDAATPPRVGEVFHAYVEVTSTAETCLEPYALPEIDLMPGLELAVSSEHPLRCARWDYSSGKGQSSPVTADCPTAPSPPVSGGDASFPTASGDPWLLPYQTGYEIRVPVRATEAGRHLVRFPSLIIDGESNPVLSALTPDVVVEGIGAEPTSGPTTEPTSGPTTEPTSGPTTEPTSGPTTEPTSGPTTEPTSGPTAEPTPTDPPTTQPPLPDVENGRIVFQSDRDGNPHLYSVAADGTGLTRLTSSGGNLDPAVSPDGTHIAWVRDGDLWTMRADGSRKRQVTSTGVAESHPTWSPDGTRLAFASTATPDGGSDLEILVTAADGSGPVRQVTHNSGTDQDPDWSPATDDAPDGRLVFSRRGPDGGIVVASPDGGDERNLTLGQRYGRFLFQGHDDDPDWHPAGNEITFTHTFEPNAGGLPAIWTVRADGSGLQRLTRSSQASDSDPSWSPDGSHLTFVRAVTTDRDVAVMRADGTAVTTPGSGGGHDVAPVWRPGGVDVWPQARVRVPDVVRLGATDGAVPAALTATPAGAPAELVLRIRRDGRWLTLATRRTTISDAQPQQLRLRVPARWQRRLEGTSVPASVRVEVGDDAAHDRVRFRLRGAKARE